MRCASRFSPGDHRLYNLAFYSYVIAFLHFNSELLIYRTTKLGKGWAGPAIVSSTSIPTLCRVLLDGD